jgi:hypothetical protein
VSETEKDLENARFKSNCKFFQQRDVRFSSAIASHSKLAIFRHFPENLDFVPWVSSLSILI